MLFLPNVVFGQEDITSKIELVGNPFSSNPIYSRNIWDMKAFENKLYLAHGDAVYNSGATAVISYDGTGFGTEFTADDEQIYKFQIIDNQLVFPGGDSCCGTGDTPGSFYRKEASGWKKYKNIPNALHVFDIYKFGNKLFAAVGTSLSNSQLYISSDNGASWSKALMNLDNLAYTVDANYAPYARFYDFFVFKNELYASGTYLSGDGSAMYPDVAKFDGKNTFVFIPPVIDGLFPGVIGTNKFMYRPVVFQDQVFYIAIQFSMNDQMLPYGFYKTSNMSLGSKINLVNGALARDIKIGPDGALYVAASSQSGSQYINYLFKSTDGNQFSPIYQFTSPTFVRSFENYKGDYYFGLGCSNSNASASCGNILSYKKPIPSPSVVKVGDLDGNQQVDIFDYNLVLTNIGKMGMGIVGDLDGNQRVDIFDYNIILSNFGK